MAPSSQELEPPANSGRFRPKSLRIFKAAMTTALIEHGKSIQPYAEGGPTVRAAPDSAVRNEFMAAYPADASDGKSKGDAKRMAFTRALKQARHTELICSREINGVDHLWLVEPGNNTNTTTNEHDTP
jgi:hypothetical protein